MPMLSTRPIGEYQSSQQISKLQVRCAATVEMDGSVLPASECRIHFLYHWLCAWHWWWGHGWQTKPVVELESMACFPL